jgi:hypothetical protein
MKAQVHSSEAFMLLAALFFGDGLIRDVSEAPTCQEEKNQSA